jgi:uncharacterized protein (UPF0147 family)
MSKFDTKEESLADVVSEACGELASLGEELRGWADNIADKFPDKADVIGEAASTLEDIREPTVPDELSELKLSISRPHRTPKQAAKLSRSTRRDDATALLSQVIEFCNEAADDPNVPEDAKDIANDLATELETIKDEADGVEFPGMYG